LFPGTDEHFSTISTLIVVLTTGISPVGCYFSLVFSASGSRNRSVVWTIFPANLLRRLLPFRTDTPGLSFSA
jgi:hypothetical protein